MNNEKESKIIMYTDGSSRGNPGPGGWGVIVADDKNVVELGGGEPMTTNNRMELTAAIEGLSFMASQLPTTNYQLPTKIDMRVDSQYVINGITKWVHGWQKNGWVNSKKERVLNRELWEVLIDVLISVKTQATKVSWSYTPGHVGIPGNERADEIATGYADKKPPELFRGAREIYETNLDQVEGNQINKKQKKSLEEKARQKMKVYSYVSLVKGKIMIHATWAECEQQVKGVKNVKFKKSVSAEDESVIIGEFKS